MKGKRPRRFSREFKIKIAKEYLETDKSYREMSTEYNISGSVIGRWVSLYEKYKEKAFENRIPGRKPSFIADKSKIPPALFEELGLDKIYDHPSDPAELEEENAKLRMKLAERELEIKMLREKSKKTE